mgnify:CR=1 FL=1
MRPEEVICQVSYLCSKYHAEKIILFGSRAKGTALKKSDIDIAVSGVKNFDQLQVEIENIPTLYSIDLVNLDECRNELLKEDIIKYGRKI